jgi:hypothetical protein
MALNNQVTSSLNLVDLDFDTLKQSLIEFLKSQNQFKDYDFTGSNLNVLLDILTHNTQKNAFFLNMNFAESFLDSAQLRASILSKAKELNYCPRSARSSVARVKVEFTATRESQPYKIQKGSSFSTFIKNTSYTFSIPENLVVFSSNNSFEFETDICEGIYVKDSYVVDFSKGSQLFRLTNKNVDTESLTVTVYENGSIIGDSYVFKKDFLDLNSRMKVYFLQASERGFYEIYFGDGVSGYKPLDKSIVVLDYRVSNGPISNGAKGFSINFDPTGEISELTSNPKVTTLIQSNNGGYPESDDSIKYYAPRHFQVQQRAVIPSDYEILLKEEFPEINAVSAYGGEEVYPPQYGKVFVAIALKTFDSLPASKKEEYYDFVRRRSSLKPVIIDPEYSYFAINSVVRYNINKTTSSINTIKTLVMNSIMNFNTNYLNDFGVILRNSPFTRSIDDSDLSIISNITDVYLFKKIIPISGEKTSINLNYGISIEDSFGVIGEKHSISEDRAVFSSKFKYNGTECYIEDDGDGILQIVKKEGTNYIKIVNAGTVDYSKGLIQINNLRFDDYDGSSFRLYVIPKDKDITISKGVIASIDPSEMIINIQPLQE